MALLRILVQLPSPVVHVMRVKRKRSKVQRSTSSRPPPQSRTERRRAARVRRNRTLLVGSVAVSAAIVAAWFPVSALTKQHAQLASIDAHVAQLQAQDRALRQDERLLNQPSEVGRLAQDQYLLVKPGQVPYQVLPPSGTAHGGSWSGDPAYQPLVNPSAASQIPPGSAPTGRPSVSSVTGSGAKPHSQGAAGKSSASLFGRILQTLEFWR